MILLVAIAAAQEDHEATAPEAIQSGSVVIPAGPPRTERAHPGDDLSTLIRTLPAGSTLTLAPGSYKGPVVLDRPMELRGEAGAVLTGGGHGSVLVVAAPDVTVRDVRVTGGGHLSNDDDSGVVIGADRFLLERVQVDDVYLGIDLRMASDGTIRDCSVRGDAWAPFGKRGDGMRLWESHRNRVERNTITDVRDLVVWYSADNVISDNLVTGSRYGTHIMHSDGNVVEGNRYLDEVVGVFVMYSARITLRDNQVTGSLGPAGVGFGFKESDGVTATGNVLVRNTTGLFLDTTPHNLAGKAEFRDNLIAGNEVGVRFHGPQYGGDLVGNAFQANRNAAATDGGVDAGQYHIEHNQWSDYAGYDLDGDGFGDLPFEARSLASSLTDRVASLSFFDGTPALALLDLFAEAFPMFRPKAILTDPAPAMTWSPTSSGGLRRHWGEPS